MIRIVATEEQARSIAAARESVEVVDAQGNHLGFFARPFSEDDIRLAYKRLASTEARKPTGVVIERLKSMEGT